MVNLDLDSWRSSLVDVPDRFRRSWLSIQERLRTSSLPLMSASITYTAFNLHVSINGGLTRLCSWCSPMFTSALLLNSHICTGLYLYRHNMFRSWSERKKILYSCYISVMFNFAGILFIAYSKTYLPNSNLLRGFYSIAASYGLIRIGLDLLSHADQNSQNTSF